MSSSVEMYTSDGNLICKILQDVLHIYFKKNYQNLFVLIPIAIYKKQSEGEQ